MSVLTVVSPDAESLLSGVRQRCANRRIAGSLGELAAILRERLPGPAAPVTLDLFGHSTRDHHLLRLGGVVVDMLNPHVARFFRRHTDLLHETGVTAIRLLGCETAVTEPGRRTVRMLARTVRVPVFGTRTPLFKSHSDAEGFNPAYAHLLVEASELAD
jgi:hypothetical protein